MKSSTGIYLVKSPSSVKTQTQYGLEPKATHRIRHFPNWVTSQRYPRPFSSLLLTFSCSKDTSNASSVCGSMISPLVCIQGISNLRDWPLVLFQFTPLDAETAALFHVGATEAKRRVSKGPLCGVFTKLRLKSEDFCFFVFLFMR